MLIKKFPEDFLVQEIPDFALKDAGKYAIYKLKKINMNTEQAIEYLCERLHVQRTNINYAGAKDKNAITTQYISIFKDNGKSGYDGKNMQIAFAGFSDEPLSLGSLKGNMFEIIVRDLENIEDIIDIPKISMIPNYFDEQRFSENNFEIGLAMIRKDFKTASQLIIGHDGYHENIIRQHLEKNPNDHVGAIRKMPKKIISMYIHSVQSLIFNNALTGILEEYAGKNNIRHKNIKYFKGRFIFYENHEDYEKISIKGLSLVGFDTNIMQTVIAEQMKSLGITQRDFIIKAIPELTMEGTTRECFAQVEGFSSEKLDEKTIKIKFSLPKGSYATIVVKALMALMG